MKIRKLLSAVLALTLGMGLAVPALAAGTAEERLVKVTQAVKSTLGVEDEYEEFYGEPNETLLGSRWSLSWTAPDKSLSVTATEEGKVLSMSLWQNSPAAVRRNGLHFPAMTLSQAKILADSFLDRVLTEGEEAVYSDGWDSSAGLNVSQYSFGGTIYLNGIPSPLSFRVRVSVDQGAVTYFHRDDPSGYVGQVPAPTTVTTAEAARALLSENLNFELIYVRDKADEKAVLRYVPRASDDYYVDAATGELINLTELRRLLSQGETGADLTVKNDMMATPEMTDSNLSQLSPTELEGIAKLEGVLDRDGLDKAARVWTELGLAGFELSTVSYRVEREESGISPMPIVVNDAARTAEEAKNPADTRVTAYLTYAKKTGTGVSRRSLTLDAKTGELQGLSGYNSYADEPVKLTQAQAQARAEAFLAKLWPDQLAKCEVYTSYDAGRLSDAYSFTFAQKVNGYFFPENALTVRVSADDGAIMAASKGFDDDVEFDEAEGLISLDKAKASWASTYAVELAYLAIPVKLDLLGSDVQPLVKAGYSYYNTLNPGYALGEQSGWGRGVDAKTGEPVMETRSETQTMTYDDLSGHWAESALRELALYNVGWWDGKADPEGKLTQAEYLKLLSSADGYRFSADQDADSLYAYAYRQGILTEGERDEGKILTRADMVRMLLDSLGYQAVANLPGIFRCDYADADTIPAGHMGYAALAQALGLVVGNEKGNYLASAPALRCEAAVLLWRYLSR